MDQITGGLCWRIVSSKQRQDLLAHRQAASSRKEWRLQLMCAQTPGRRELTTVAKHARRERPEHRRLLQSCMSAHRPCSHAGGKAASKEARQHSWRAPAWWRERRVAWACIQDSTCKRQGAATAEQDWQKPSEARAARRVLPRGGVKAACVRYVESAQDAACPRARDGSRGWERRWRERCACVRRLNKRCADRNHHAKKVLGCIYGLHLFIGLHLMEPTC